MYQWEDNSIITDSTCYFVEEDEAGYTIKATIEYPDQGGWEYANIEIFIRDEKYRTGNFGYRLVSGENIFIFSLGRGEAKDLKKACQDFYDKNLKDKDITKEYLLKLKEEFKNV